MRFRFRSNVTQRIPRPILERCPEPCKRPTNSESAEFQQIFGSRSVNNLANRGILVTHSVTKAHVPTFAARSISGPDRQNTPQMNRCSWYPLADSSCGCLATLSAEQSDGPPSFITACCTPSPETSRGDAWGIRTARNFIDFVK